MKIKNKLVVTVFILIALAIAFSFFQRNDRTEKQEELEKVLVFFATRDAMYLEAEERAVNTSALYRNTMEELINGPANSTLSPTIPEGVKLLNLKVEAGTVLLDFNRALVENHWGGSTGETLTIYSIVHTMTQFPPIKKVQILLDGKKVETLAGHMDLLAPLEPDHHLIKKPQ